ncbi:MAG: hypothetical protein COU31_05115 [Candidatus Magasanikbacteria bacterium CG10_big_fil_rev_8_21_14_0_10_40_10]|uniref:TrbC/VIRB2 family protein n=1 Tax=Candidatus Magasanikbacteria bacterium CG10_big_fil_rev_8_21_14_0_10_40_10 TaxID=1974648 RepID=A0A2M6W2M2_9BACT|nr:MAG: hypothetical protein COU31_05115 [Candidatus Magasanikbacteria bacterium CG10_big_fil_rev_8_21_14_0_10_40_10]
MIKAKIAVMIGLMSVLTMIFVVSPTLVQAKCETTSAGVTTCSLDNPLQTTEPNIVIGNIVKALMGVTGALSLWAFVEGASKWLRSMGNPEQINKGMHTMLWAVLGLLVVFISYAIAKWVLRLFFIGQAW